MVQRVNGLDIMKFWGDTLVSLVPLSVHSLHFFKKIEITITSMLLQRP